jgi:transcriptional regulator with XRE-family HTH domain
MIYMSVNQKIKDSLKRGDIARIAEILGLAHQTVSIRLKSDVEIDSVDFINAVCQVTGKPFEYFKPVYNADEPTADMEVRFKRIAGQPDEEKIENMAYDDVARHWKKKYEQLKSGVIPINDDIVIPDRKPIPITVNPSGEENIVLVNQTARAGYLQGYGDPEYVSHLPAFNLPGFNQGTYRMFQVEGDSMYQFGGAGLYDGDIVIAQFIENPMDIRDSRVYVVVSSEGVLIKRCINRLNTENRVLICNSDNKNGEYPPIMVKPEDIKEVWEFKAKISRQIPENLDYYNELTDLRGRMTLLEKKLK